MKVGKVEEIRLNVPTIATLRPCCDTLTLRAALLLALAPRKHRNLPDRTSVRLINCKKMGTFFFHKRKISAALGYKGAVAFGSGGAATLAAPLGHFSPPGSNEAENPARPNPRCINSPSRTSSSSQTGKKNRRTEGQPH